jgi:hypothetical protein
VADIVLFSLGDKLAIRQLCQFIPCMVKISRGLDRVGKLIAKTMQPNQDDNQPASETADEANPGVHSDQPASSTAFADEQKAAGKSSTPLHVLFARITALFLLGTALYATVSFSQLIESSDYLSAFYVAGKAVVSGQPEALYPLATDRDFHMTAFNQLAHKLLPHLPPGLTAIYMYSPANALLYAPFALLPTVASMLSWQAFSLAALVLATMFAARLPVEPLQLQRPDGAAKETPAKHIRIDDAFFALCLFFPIIHTLLIGQLGLLVGLLPMAAALLLLLRKRELLAGLCFSFMLLKPHFLPVALLVAGVLALNKRWQCAAGLVVGCLGLVVVSAAVLGPGSWLAFLHSFGMTDTFFSNPSYGVPIHLISCLPGTAMQAVAPEQRHLVKLVTYTIAALCGLHALLVCNQLYKRESHERALLLTMMTGILILPIVVPHLLFYDLCVYGLVGLLVFALPWPREDKFVLTVWTSVSWIGLNIFYVAAVAASKALPSPLLLPALLVVFLITLYARMLKLAMRG